MQNDKPRSILIVDDSAFMRKRIHQILEDDGYLLVDANNGTAALEAIDKEEFTCILTDLVMPDLDGFGLLAELKGRSMSTPVIVLSADVQNSTREQCEALGAYGLLQKPVNPDSLKLALNTLIRARSQPCI